MKSIIITLIALVFFSSCNNKEIDDSNLFVGAYRIIDQMVPYPYIIQQKKDSIYLFNNNGVIIDRTKNKEIKNNTKLTFKRKHLKVLKKKENNFVVFDLLDSINFLTLKNGEPYPLYRAKFEKIEYSNKIDIVELKNNMVHSIWKYDVIEDENSNPNNDLKIEQLIHFKKDSLNIITNYYYKSLKTVSEYETKAYSVFEIDNIYFLSYQKEKDNPQPIYQIIKSNSNTIELKDFSSRDIKNISYYKDSISKEDYIELIKNTSSYSNCFDAYQAEYYFGDDVTFNKGNKYILDLVNIDAPKTETKSGYIIIHFNINCNSEVGNFGLIQMSKTFKQTSFSKETVNHLINKVSQLKSWPSTYSQSKRYTNKDVHAFLMFKIENGKITDLCP